MAAVVMCPAPVHALPGSGASASEHVNERFYQFGTPSPPEQPSPDPAVYSDLEDSGFHSDEEMQKVCHIIYATLLLCWRNR